MISSRGEVDETGKEEPGGVGGVGGEEEMSWKGDVKLRRGIFFKKHFLRNSSLVAFTLFCLLVLFMFYSWPMVHFHFCTVKE